MSWQMCLRNSASSNASPFLISHKAENLRNETLRKLDALPMPVAKATVIKSPLLKQNDIPNLLLLKLRDQLAPFPKLYETHAFVRKLYIIALPLPPDAASFATFFSIV